MKKIIFLSAIALLCASMVFAAGITKKDLAGLKGTWSGEVSSVGGQGCVANLEIMNDTVPVEAKITVSNIPMQTQKDYNVQATFLGESKNGKLTSAGTIMFTGGADNFFEISSVKDGKMSGWFFINGLKGSFGGKKK
jgi:hypothetical protein